MSTVQEAKESMGLARLQPSSNLWAHVFGKSSNIRSSETGTSLPPLGPIDKNATSTRVLLHDTQANLEKFSARVDTLLNSFSEARTEVKLVKTLFERDREALTNDIIDLVNRCQTQIQKTVGSPAQSLVLDQFSREVNQRLENLDKRLDAIQTLSQTHAQSLQTQIQVIQALQEQQCSILAALTPLMPLLQAFPLHIDLAKNSLLDTIRATRQPIPSNVKATQTSPLAHSYKDCGSNKRLRTTTSSDNLATLTPHATKRSRVDTEAVTVPSHLLPVPAQSRSCTPTKLPRRPSNHNLPASSSRPKTKASRGRTTSGTRQNDSRQVPSQQHIPTPGGCANAQRAAVTDPTKPCMKRASITRDKFCHPIQKQSTVSLAPRSGEPTGPNSRETDMRSATPNFAMPVQQTKIVNDLRRTSTQAITLQSTATLAQGSQARQLNTAMTLVPTNNGFQPPKRRRSPPKAGRRFIPLLDSDDEEIASP